MPKTPRPTRQAPARPDWPAIPLLPATPNAVLGQAARFYIPDDFRRLVTDEWHGWRWTLPERDRATDRAYAGFPEDLFFVMERIGLAGLEGNLFAPWMAKATARLIPGARRSFARWDSWFFAHTPQAWLEEHGWVWREPPAKLDFSTLTTREL